MEYFVIQNGNARQDGSREFPFAKISQAAEIARPGDVVLIGDGIYREWVRPAHAGTAERRIVYRAIEGARPVVSGAEIIGNFHRVSDSLYKTEIPRVSFGAYCPYEEKIAGDWFCDLGRVHHTGEIFVNGTALYEAPDLGRIADPDLPGKNRWFAESAGDTVSVWIYLPDGDPADCRVEASFRPFAFFPDKEQIGYITVSGLTIENVATQWAPPTAFQAGAIGPNWSRGWIIENCVIRNSKCVGVSLGKRAEISDNQWSRDPSKGGAQTYTETCFRNLRADWDREHVGGHIVRGNRIAHCGQAGIVGCMGGAFSTIEQNLIYDVGTRGEFDGAEIAGVKLHAAIDVVIRGNVVHSCERGLWLDWQAQGARVCGNVFFDNRSQDIFLEVCHGPAIFDHNLFLSQTSLLNVSQGSAFLHNLFAGKIENYPELRRFTMYHFPHETAVAGSMVIYGGDDRVIGNLFVGDETCGSAGYDGCRAEDQALDTSAEDYQIPKQEGEALTLAVRIRGNAYCGGARHYEKETSALHAGEATLRVLRSPQGYSLDLALPEGLFSARIDRLDSDALGCAFESGGRYENPDGTKIVFDRDFLGAKRAETTPPGPFTTPVQRLFLCAE